MTQTERLDIEEILNDLPPEKILGKRFLITGSTGSLARYCALSLLEFFERNQEKAGKVILLCRNEEKARSIFHDYLKKSYCELIICSVEQTIAYNEPIHYILHAASMSNTAFFNAYPVETLSANAVGTYQMLCLAREKAVSGFLFFSSGAVFGGHANQKSIYASIDPLQSKNCYALSKQIGENLCVSFFSEYGVPAKIVRIGKTYGPHANLNDGHLYSDFIREIVERKPLVIKGNGKSQIGLCYVTDAVRAFFKVLFKGESGTAYLMRNYLENMPIESVARVLVNDAFPERNLSVRCLSEGMPDDTVALIPERLLALGWSPRVSLVEGFRRCVACVEERDRRSR